MMAAASGWLQVAETARALTVCREDQATTDLIRAILERHRYEAQAQQLLDDEENHLDRLVDLVEDHLIEDLLQGIDETSDHDTSGYVTD